MTGPLGKSRPQKSTWHVILKYTNDLSLGTTGTLGRNPIDDL